MTLAVATKSTHVKEYEETISRNVKLYLSMRGMPQSSLAEPLGIRQSSVSMKMKGNTAWSVADVVNAADFLGVLPEDLLDDSVLRSAQAKYGVDMKKAAGGPAAVKLPQLGLNQRHFD